MSTYSARMAGVSPTLNGSYVPQQPLDNFRGDLLSAMDSASVHSTNSYQSPYALRDVHTHAHTHAQDQNGTYFYTVSGGGITATQKFMIGTGEEQKLVRGRMRSYFPRAQDGVDLRGTGPLSTSEAATIFSKTDLNNDGFVTLAEFGRAMAHSPEAASRLSKVDHHLFPKLVASLKLGTFVFTEDISLDQYQFARIMCAANDNYSELKKLIYLEDADFLRDEVSSSMLSNDRSAHHQTITPKHTHAITSDTHIHAISSNTPMDKSHFIATPVKATPTPPSIQRDILFGPNPSQVKKAENAPATSQASEELIRKNKQLTDQLYKSLKDEEAATAENQRLRKELEQLRSEHLDNVSRVRDELRLAAELQRGKIANDVEATKEAANREIQRKKQEFEEQQEAMFARASADKERVRQLLTVEIDVVREERDQLLKENVTLKYQLSQETARANDEHAAKQKFINDVGSLGERYQKGQEDLNQERSENANLRMALADKTKTVVELEETNRDWVALRADLTSKMEQARREADEAEKKCMGMEAALVALKELSTRLEAEAVRKDALLQNGIDISRRALEDRNAIHQRLKSAFNELTVQRQICKAQQGIVSAEALERIAALLGDDLDLEPLEAIALQKDVRELQCDCALCGKVFKDETDLQQHMTSAHTLSLVEQAEVDVGLRPPSVDMARSGDVGGDARSHRSQVSSHNDDGGDADTSPDSEVQDNPGRVYFGTFKPPVRTGKGISLPMSKT